MPETSPDADPTPSAQQPARRALGPTTAYRSVLAATLVCCAVAPLALAAVSSELFAPLLLALLILGLAGMIATFVLAKRAGKGTVYALVAAGSPLVVLVISGVALAAVIVFLVIAGAGGSGYI